MSAPKRMGRPPISAEGAKATVLIVRVSPEEKATIEAAAKRADTSVSEWVRRELLRASTIDVSSPPDINFANLPER